MKYSGEHLDGVIDVTIAYSPQDLTYIDYLSGKGRARVHVDLISPPEMLQASEGEGGRKVVQEWLNELWQQKDQRLRSWCE